MYDKLSEERKKMQNEGSMPMWWSTASWQLFKDKYLYQANTPKEQYMRIASTASLHTTNPEYFKDRFFDLIWKGWLSLSTPIMANMGTDRGLPVSCAGSYVPDTIDGIYKSKHETAMLTKMGFGTAGYLGDVRPRGSSISGGGTSSGVMPIIEGFQKDMEYVAQGSARRGSWAGYLPLEHGDFYEVCAYLESNPDSNNIGWCVSDEILNRLRAGDEDITDRYATAMRCKMITGKGYWFFTDKANAKRPATYVEHGLDIKSPQLCLTYDTKIQIASDCYGSNKREVPLGFIAEKVQLMGSVVLPSFVLSYNTETKTQEWKLIEDGGKTGEVTELYEIEDENGNVIKCTPEHKIWTDNRGYVEAKNLEVGDMLIVSNSALHIKRVSQVHGEYVEVYDITVSDNHNFYANNIVVSNCNEIMLHSSDEFTYTCVLSSMNLTRWDEWKDTDAPYIATIFLDCVVQEFLNKSKYISGLEHAVAATEKGRALGLGVCGFHSYLQEHMIPFESFDAHMINNKMFAKIRSDAESATKWLAEELGEPEWCKGHNRRNTHLIAIAPTKSSSVLMGGISEGINPDTAMVFTQRTPAGEIDRINPAFLKLMKERGQYNKKTVDTVRDSMGSVAGLDWLSDEEKLVFKTAFEINQRAVLRLASTRSKYIDQWQSLNLFFGADETEEEVNDVHAIAFNDPNILGLYYVYSKAGIQASNDKTECLACQ